MKKYRCQFKGNETPGDFYDYQAENPESAANMLLLDHGLGGPKIFVSWGVIGEAWFESEKLKEGRRFLLSSKRETTRDSIQALKREISQLPNSADYLDLSENLREDLRHFENTITATPLEDWNEDEKSVFRFWNKLEKHGLDGGIRDKVSTPRVADSQLLSQILNHQKIQTRQLTALRWGAAFFFLWFLLHIYWLPILNQ